MAPRPWWAGLGAGEMILVNYLQSNWQTGALLTNTTLSIGVASFSLRFYLYAGATFLAQAKACYSIL